MDSDLFPLILNIPMPAGNRPFVVFTALSINYLPFYSTRRRPLGNFKSNKLLQLALTLRPRQNTFPRQVLWKKTKTSAILFYRSM